MLHTVELPYHYKHPQVTYHRDKKVYVYKGALLPKELQPFKSEDFSYSRWHEDELNGIVMGHEPSPDIFTPRDHQVEAGKQILRAYDSGWPGFLLADKTGVGKTLSMILGITLIAKRRGFKGSKKAKVLIVCPKRAIPVWRQTLRSYPESLKYIRPLVTNYDQLNKLLEAPSQAKVVKKAKTKKRVTAREGKSVFDWDIVVFDEAHVGKNFPSSMVSMAMASIGELNTGYRKDISPYVIYGTATPGATPLNLSLLSQILSRLIDPKAKNITPKKWGQFLADQKFHVTKGKSGWTWIQPMGFGKNSSDPKKRAEYEAKLKESKILQKQDTRRIAQALMTRGAPFLMRGPKDIAGWPEQQIEPLLLSLSPGDYTFYKQAWTRFRDFMRLTPARSNPQGQLVEQLRFRQKSSLLKVDGIVEHIVDLVEQGNQVYVSCEFLETIDRYKEKLAAKKINVSEYTGRIGSEAENERIRFQLGESKVILSNVLSAVSFHAGEILPEGLRATNNPRITIIHDIRQNNLDTEQALGRCHRDGQFSLAYFPLIEKTVEENVVSRYIQKTTNMKRMLGADDEEAEWLENIFRNAAMRKEAPNRLS